MAEHVEPREEARYSPELMDKICNMIACGAWMSEIEQLPGMPNQASVWHWRRKYPEARENYEEAVLRRCETVQDEHRKLIRNCPLSANAIKLLEVQLKTEMWYMERLFPKKFGARTTISGDKDNPIEMNLAKSLDQKIADARSKQKTLEHKPMRMPIVDVEGGE